MSQCVEKTVKPLARDEFAAIMARAVSVPCVEAAAQSDNSADSTTSLSPLDDESQAWVSALRSEGGPRDQAVARLHELLLKAARFEVSRRRASAPLERKAERSRHCARRKRASSSGPADAAPSGRGAAARSASERARQAAGSSGPAAATYLQHPRAWLTV